MCVSGCVRVRTCVRSAEDLLDSAAVCQQHNQRKISQQTFATVASRWHSHSLTRLRRGAHTISHLLSLSPSPVSLKKERKKDLAARTKESERRQTQ